MGSISEDTLPTLEREISYASHVASGSAMHSVTETPIGDVIMQ